MYSLSFYFFRAIFYNGFFKELRELSRLIKMRIKPSLCYSIAIDENEDKIDLTGT